MSEKAIRLTLAACSALLLMVSQGCSQNTVSSSTRMSRTSWRADLDEYREVKLSCDLIRDRETGEPERVYEQLTLEVLPREHLRLRRALKEVELKPGVARGQIAYRDVAIRSDPQRSRVWFVDRESGRVIATLDKETGKTTGPDDQPPEWADPAGGLVLESGK